MTTRYRVEYALKTHRRDQLIEWIKGLLAVPFVLNSQPTAAQDNGTGELATMAKSCHDRYAEVMRDVEALVNDHIQSQVHGSRGHSKLKLLVPSVGTFFTPLRLEEAFVYQDSQRAISRRRFVAPSFNDIRLILNTAQLLSLVRPHSNGSASQAPSRVKLLTFDGDVTLYDDGASLLPTNPVIPRLLHLLSLDIRIGIVTAAGYADPAKYYGRLHGLLDAISTSSTLTSSQKSNLVIMGGESNFLFVFDPESSSLLRYIRRRDWILPSMLTWSESSIQSLLSVAESAFTSIVSTLQLPAAPVMRKERAVGIYPAVGHKFTREQLEETVLVVQQVVEQCGAAKDGLPFCAFNGGNDVFVDIGDKSWGVRVLQKWFGGVTEGETLHVGDQFLSAGANDFKARLACCTAWIASPAETVALLDEMIALQQ